VERGRFLRLSHATMAIAQRDSGNVAILVPQGAIIEALGPFDGVHLTDVKYDGEIVIMFSEAIEAHTEAIKPKTAGTN